jgi:hypothetical protein
MTNNKQQTAVEWFSVRRDVLEIEVRLGKLSPIEYAEELTKAEQQAKEKEKKQMDKVAEDWWNEGARSVHDGKKKYESFEQYYDEIYGNNHIGEVNKMVGGDQ